MWTTNYNWDYKQRHSSMQVVEDRLEAFTGLLDMNGDPIFRAKRIGFDLGKKNEQRKCGERVSRGYESSC